MVWDFVLELIKPSSQTPQRQGIGLCALVAKVGILTPELFLVLESLEKILSLAEKSAFLRIKMMVSEKVRKCPSQQLRHP